MKDIQKLTKYFQPGGTSGSITGTAMSEVNFWVGIEKALFHVRNQLQSPDVEFTLGVLRLGKRFLTSVSFESD
ncbi:unnamed protein product, partial [Amoebophrya sp. A120]|eukprot:GSA120T00014712001.1